MTNPLSARVYASALAAAINTHDPVLDAKLAQSIEPYHTAIDMLLPYVDNEMRSAILDAMVDMV